jgi:hypothetical protein
MGIKLFHVTSRSYAVGEKLIASTEKSNSFHRAEKKGLDWVEGILDKYRPDDAPSRCTAIFTFDEIKFCGLYVVTESIANPVYYKLEVQSSWKAPMAMVNRINKLGKAMSFKHIVAAKEYWRPTMDWNCYEFLVNEAVVLDKCDPPPSVDIKNAKSLYFKDVDLTKNI